MSKETYERDLQMSKETYERDLYMSKETYAVPIPLCIDPNETYTTE